MLGFKLLWWISFFLVFWAMIGYPLSLLLIDKLLKRRNAKDYSYEPTVTIMTVAHNEESVIFNKLENLMSLDYPPNKIKYLVASDYSTDQTDYIVENFINSHPDKNIQIHKSINHFGKTNAQNEAQKLCDSEILVMTDANAILDTSAIKELVASFSSPEIAYVTGQLKYLNTDNEGAASSEGLYWKIDLFCRNVESNIKTITAGNGALYAVRNSEYRDIPNIESHDSSFPILFALNKKRAIYNSAAIAYEKAGETNVEEFKRKVRMNRVLLRHIIPDYRVFNCFSYGWFSYFYFGHRTCRYLLWLLHLLLLIVNIPLCIMSMFWRVLLLIQLITILIAFIGWMTKSKNRLVKMLTYYLMTVLAQWKGIIISIKGKSEATWEKAESTR